MQFLKEVTVKGPNQFLATYKSGATSCNLRVAKFFMLLQDRGENMNQAKSTIALGKKVDFQTDWDEVDRIMASFKKVKKK